MDAKKCDRCGDYYVPAIGWSYRIEKHEIPVERVDLCNNCMYAFEEWMKGGKKDAV